MTVRICLAILMAMFAVNCFAEETELRLFDFEQDADLLPWSNLKLPGAKSAEPDVKIEQSAENATAGKSSLKLTFSGGAWPTVITRQVPEDWTDWNTFQADVTASRACVAGFCVMQENSSRAAGWDGGVSRWAKTQFLKAGKNTVTAELHPNEWSALRTKLENGRVLGKVVSLEIFLYQPLNGETLFVDNIRVSTKKQPPAVPSATKFQVLGTDLHVANIQELSKKLADQWTMPTEQTAEERQALFQKRFDELKAGHPKAVLAVFRDGERGFDPAMPEKVYSGWRDAYWSSHGPDGLTIDRSTNFGASETQEIFMRHRSPLMKVDVSSIPVGSNILAAELLIVRAGDPAREHSPLKPNMWVVEACNRPWAEHEVDAYRYSRDKYWQAIGGMAWDGNDPDFWPIYLAHGPSQPGCCHWDLTHAVRFWTDGQHANHGFMLHGDSKDWFRAWFREATVIKNRPALLVIYEPK